jgi:hypothetical protein
MNKIELDNKIELNNIMEILLTDNEKEDMFNTDIDTFIASKQDEMQAKLHDILLKYRGLKYAEAMEDDPDGGTSMKDAYNSIITKVIAGRVTGGTVQVDPTEQTVN